MLKRFFFIIQYLGKPRWDTGVTPPELVEMINRVPPGYALDIGCGTGTNVIKLAQNGWKVTGIDFIPKAIHDAKRKANLANIDAEFHIVDVSKPLPVNQRFDLILDIGCFHSLNLNAQAGYLHNIEKHLSSKGIYLLYSFISQNNNQPGLSESTINQLTTRFNLINRSDGMDTSTNRYSTWFTFKNGT